VSFTPTPALASRAIRDFRQVPSPAADPAGFVRELGNFIQLSGHDMLIPADDQALLAVTEHYRELKDLAQLACPPPEVTSGILDKSSTLQIAQSCGIRIPKTKLIANSKQLSELVPNLPFPWVLKPARKELSVEEVKSLTIATPDEIAVKLPTPRQFDPPMLLQEFCPGVGVGVEMLMHREECLAVFQHRRLQEYPHTGGFSVTAIAERPDPLLAEKSLALLRALHWEGPAMVEFKVNPADGNAVLMEVNGRYWGTLSLPVFLGIDFPLYHWQLLHGERPTVPDSYTAGATWRWTAGHVLRFHDLLIAARRSGSARSELLSYFLPAGSIRSGCEALFSSSDQMPVILDLLGIIKYLCAYDLRAIFGRTHLANHAGG
jgi:predicted ATP-grasp superfamily ATP-dependent carboligase